MEIAVAHELMHDHQLLINYMLILVFIPFIIICVLITCVAIVLYITLWMGFYTLILLVVNVVMCIVTGVEPGAGMDCMYVIADTTAVALVACAIYFRPANVAHGTQDEDTSEDEAEQAFGGDA